MAASTRRIPNVDGRVFETKGTQLFDLHADPNQLAPLRDPGVEARLGDGIADVLRAHDAPRELFARYGLDPVDGACS